MAGQDPIEAYLRELKHELRGRRGRRRIVAEVRAHLLDATEAERTDSGRQGGAAERALARFGGAGEVACQFNRLVGRRRAVLRRALVPWAAAVAFTSLATATVWASHPGASPSRPRPALGHPALGKRCEERAVGLAQGKRQTMPRSSTGPVRRTQSVCGAPEAPAR